MSRPLAGLSILNFSDSSKRGINSPLSLLIAVISSAADASGLFVPTPTWAKSDCVEIENKNATSNNLNDLVKLGWNKWQNIQWLVYQLEFSNVNLKQ